jgi:hypothetical protein
MFFRERAGRFHNFHLQFRVDEPGIYVAHRCVCVCVCFCVYMNRPGRPAGATLPTGLNSSHDLGLNSRLRTNLFDADLNFYRAFECKFWLALKLPSSG